MNTTIKEKHFVIIPTALVTALVSVVLLSPASTNAVVSQSEPAIYIELTEEEMVYGQDVVQADMNRKLGELTRDPRFFMKN